MNPCPKCGGLITVKLLKRRKNAPPIYSFTCADCGYSQEGDNLIKNNDRKESYYRISIPEDVKQNLPD